MLKKISPLTFSMVVMFCLIIVLCFTTGARADLAVSEADLATDGAAYEINPDAQGMLWISDYSTGEVWGVDPTSGAYTSYDLGGAPVDARQADGWLWSADGLSNSLYRVSTSNGDYTQWEVPDSYGFLGTSLDADGRFYATDNVFPYLYRLDPSGELCIFDLQVDSASYYMVRHGNYLWLGDGYDSMLFRIQLDNNEMKSWSLPGGSSPFGMVVDGLGNLWYADQGDSSISVLDPNSNQITNYALPEGYYPQMVAIQSGYIWYTEEGQASIGRLDPLIAQHTHADATLETQTLEPACSPISSAGTGTAPMASGNLSWADTSYPTLTSANGWMIYQLPDSSSPWGITVPELGYVVDSGRQQLVRFTPPTDTTLTVLKHVVNDSGGTAVASDFTLTVTNAGADPSSFPGAESPGTQVTLQPGAYSVAEDGPDGYSASYSEGCSGTITPGQSKTCTITNDDLPGGYNIFLPIIVK
jgi:streptogramin lyase